jgi:hypothetical protein
MHPAIYGLKWRIGKIVFAAAGYAPSHFKKYVLKQHRKT